MAEVLTFPTATKTHEDKFRGKNYFAGWREIKREGVPNEV